MAVAALAAAGCSSVKVPATPPLPPGVPPPAVQASPATTCQLYGAWLRSKPVAGVSAALGAIVRAASAPVDAGALQAAGQELADDAAMGEDYPPPVMAAYRIWERGMTLLQAAGDELAAGSAEWKAAAAALEAGGRVTQHAEYLANRACPPATQKPLS